MATCGNCNNLVFKNRRQQVRHMLEVHESAFIDGSEDLQEMQEDYLNSLPKDHRLHEVVRRAKEDN